MKELIIEPLIEVNGIKFGESRQKVREAFGKYQEFKKTPFSESTTDDFGMFHVFYDGNDNFEAIEVFDDAIIKVDGVKVFPGTLESILEAIEGFVDEDGYYTNYDLSIGLTLDDDDRIESILFGCKGYYS